jgi:hypothetical protein
LASFIWTKSLTLLTPVFIFIVLLVAAGGHGYYESAIVLFPAAMIASVWQKEIGFAYLLLGLLQYPCYGLLLDSLQHTRIKPFLPWIMLLIHLLTAVVILVNRSSEFR